ncbi:MAG: endonuclease/exonuclease/phosphatase family protein [Nannocystis sp.]|nr:endonuclease/exonuclease/phosphatase family protein [Nannocystis sp.]
MPTTRASAALVLASLISPALLACGDDITPADLGTSPQDQVKLADAPRLAYLAEALAGGADLTVEDLFFEDRVDFAAAPDPTPLFELQAAEHAALAPLSGALTLRVLSYNLGLLDRWYPFTHVGVPEIDHRRLRAPEELLSADWDVLCLQEVFELEDVDRLRAAADTYGYAVFAGTDDKHVQHGLVILVRDQLLAAPQGTLEVQYEAQREIEYFPGPWVRRGFLRWSFRHAPTGRVLHVYNTHMTSFPELWRQRIAQARHLGLDAADRPADDLVLVAGDFNAAPYYPDDIFGDVDGEPVVDWWRNATMYPLFLHYGGLVDTHSLLTPATDVLRMAQLRLPFDGAAYRAEPLAGRCAEIAHDAFTGSDCNSLYFRQYAGTEYPARLDYILMRDPSAHARVLTSEIVYTEPLDFGAAGAFELSDHYGYAVTLALQ